MTEETRNIICPKCGFATATADGKCFHCALRADNAQLRQWVNDLQSGMFINCVYCGHRYGPKDKVACTMQEALKRHVEQCPKHPMSALRRQIELKNETLTALNGLCSTRLARITELEAQLENAREAWRHFHPTLLVTAPALRLLQEMDAALVPEGSAPGTLRPRIVCLCGSGRFKEAFDEAECRETLAGKIVLTIGCNMHDIARTADLKHYKPALDELHLRKIDLADEVLILNVNGYIGESTRRELEYARANGKVIHFLEPEKARKG